MYVCMYVCMYMYYLMTQNPADIATDMQSFVSTNGYRLA